MEPTSYDQMRPGCWNIHERIRDMNVNGVLAQLCFPSFPSFSGGRFAALDDKKLALILLQAYNDWHIDEWCVTYEGRFMPLALPVTEGVLGQALPRLFSAKVQPSRTVCKIAQDPEQNL